MKNIHSSSVVLMFWLVTACGQTIPTQNAQPVMINTCDTTVVLAKKGTATVRLPLISSTGFTWQLAAQSDAALLEKIPDQEVITPLEKNDMDGNTELQSFNLKATKKTGVNVLTFHYRRSFEKSKPPLKVCTITIEVK